MARGTKERFQKWEGRVPGIAPAAAEPPPKNYDANQCPMCRILIGLHSFRDLQDCMRVAAERRVQP